MGWFEHEFVRYNPSFFLQCSTRSILTRHEIRDTRWQQSNFEIARFLRGILSKESHFCSFVCLPVFYCLFEYEATSTCRFIVTPTPIAIRLVSLFCARTFFPFIFCFFLFSLLSLSLLLSLSFFLSFSFSQSLFLSFSLYVIFLLADINSRSTLLWCSIQTEGLLFSRHKCKQENRKSDTNNQNNHAHVIFLTLYIHTYIRVTHNRR